MKSKHKRRNAHIRALAAPEPDPVNWPTAEEREEWQRWRDKLTRAQRWARKKK